MKIIVSNPRYGSTHISKHYDAINRENCEVHEFEGFNEFLLLAPHSNELFGDNLEDRIRFIEEKRKKRIEVLYKIHAFHLFYPYKNGIVYDWFKKFYDGHEIIVLKRRNLWRAYLSILVHYQVGRRFWHKYNDKDEEDFLKFCETIEFKHDDRVLENFIHQMDCINQVEGDVIYLEDTEIETNHKPWTVNYEDLFDAQELLKTRGKFYDKTHKPGF